MLGGVSCNVPHSIRLGDERYNTQPFRFTEGVAVISAKKHKGQRRERQSVTAKREKLQTLKFLTAILTLPNLS